MSGAGNAAISIVLGAGHRETGERLEADKSVLPPDAEVKGFEEVVIQDIRLTTEPKIEAFLGHIGIFISAGRNKGGLVEWMPGLVHVAGHQLSDSSLDDCLFSAVNRELPVNMAYVCPHRIDADHHLGSNLLVGIIMCQ